MKSFGLFVLFAMLIAFSNATHLKNKNANNGDKKKSNGPKGPKDRSEWNETPFGSSNVNFLESGAMIEIDNSRIFAANYTFTEQTTYHTGVNSKNRINNGVDWINLPTYDYTFENDCTLARLKINMIFPGIGHYGRGGFLLLGLFLDGERISSASNGYYNEKGVTTYGWRNPLDSLTLSGTVFNVLSKSHKIEVKFKATYYWFVDQEFWAGTDRTDMNKKYDMDLWSPPHVNLNMFGECL